MKREYSELSIGGGDNELPLPAETQGHSHHTEATVRTGTQTPPQQTTTTESEPSPPISPPTTTNVSTSATALDSQQHPKILGFHVFSSKRSFKRQRSITSTGSELESDQSTTTTTAATTSLTDLLLPTPILQRLYEHIPLPPIQPVTDDELVRYTMASVNAIRNGDVAQLRTILQQQLQQQQQQHDTLSWFDGRNRNGESLLHLACRRSTVDVVQFLIEEAQVNLFVTDLCGRTCLHDICWRPRVEEALPIFQLVRQHFMTTLHTKRMEEQQERMSAAAAVNYNNIVTVASVQPPVMMTTTTTNNNHHHHKIPPLPWLSMWPLQPDIRGHVCFDYCRQEHWYEWNTYLQQQLNDMMMMMLTRETTATSHHHIHDPLAPPPPLLPDHHHHRDDDNDHHDDHIHPETGPMPGLDRAGSSSPPRGCTIG